MSAHPGYALILEARKQDLAQEQKRLALAVVSKKKARIQAHIDKLTAEIASLERMIEGQAK